MMVRFIILLLYAVGVGLAYVYVQRHPPKISPKYADPISRALKAILRMGGPLVTPLLALLWWGILPVSPLWLMWHALFIPVIVYLVFFLWTGAWKANILAPLLLIAVLFEAVALLPLLRTEGSPLLAIAFLLSMALPPLLQLVLLMIWVPVMMPMPPDKRKEQRRDIMAHFVGFFTSLPKPTIFIQEGQPQTHVAGNPFQGTGPGLVVTEPENIVIIRDSAKIVGPQGPGTLFTAANQTVERVVDLRDQIRIGRVRAMTRDGIEVELPIASIFRIDAGLQRPELGKPWPYHRSAAYQAVFAAEVNPDGKTPLDAHRAASWEELPLEAAKHKLQQVVGKYSLDELYGVSDTPDDPIPRAGLSREVREYVQQVMQPHGIHVTGGGVGNRITPVDEAVTRQRVEAWKAKWIRKVMENAGKAAAAWLKASRHAQAQAWNDLLRGFIEQSQAMRQVKPQAAETFYAVYLLEVLEEIARDPRIQPLLPESALPALKKLRMQLNGEASIPIGQVGGVNIALTTRKGERQ